MNTTPLHLLIVEDEAAHVEALRRAFEGAGANVEIRAVGTLRAFRAGVAERMPDLALIDLNLPDGRAVEVLTYPPETAPFPILVMTAFGTQEIVVEVMKAGALDYVVKSPEAFAAMPRTLERVFREWKLLQKQKQAMEVLRHQKEILQITFDSAPVMIALLDSEGHHQLVNHCWQSTLGWSLEEAMNKDVLAEFYPDPACRVSVVAYIKRAAGNWGDFKTRTRDGRVLDTSWINVSLSDGSNIGFGIDITERKRAEEKIYEQATLLDQTSDAILVRSLAGDITFWNRGAERLFGWTAQEILGRNVKETMVPAISRGQVEAAERRVLEQGYWLGEINYVTKTGQEIIGLARATLMNPGSN
jgi:PAS domain S-box-containing protein